MSGFPARGGDHVCKECKKLPPATRRHVEEMDEILGFLAQSHISDKNIGRLKVLVESPDQEIAGLASVVLEVGQIHPYKRGRLKILARERKELFARLEELGLLAIK